MVLPLHLKTFIDICNREKLAKAAHNIWDASKLVEHFLVMTSALVGRSGLNEVA